MVRILSLLLFAACSANALAAGSAVDIDTAGAVYLAAGLREQVSASLPSMPRKMRQLFASESSNKLSEQQLDAVTAAAKRGFRIDAFEPLALAAFAANLDSATVAKSLAFLRSATGRRMVEADIALAELDEATIDKVTAGRLVAPSTPARDALFAKLEQAADSTRAAVQIYLTIGRAVAVGTAMGSGLDLAEAQQRVGKTGPTAPADELARSMQVPLGRYLAYGYRDLSRADLQKILAFLQSKAGKTYVHAYIAAMSAGFDAMGRRCGERIGESWREIALAQARDRMLGAPAADTAPPPAPAPVP